MTTWQKWDDYLTDVDRRVRTGLNGVSLVSEVGIPSRTSILALRFHVAMREKLPTDARGRFLYRHRLSLVAGIVGIARDLYEQGGLWPYIDQALMARGHARGLDNNTRDDYRRAFIDALREYHLPTVGDGYEMVDSAAMHAGIPTYCLDDWFNLTERARRHVGNDPSEMTLWARTSSARPVMADIDKPIKTMLIHGPEFAADLFERAAELMDHLATEYSTAELSRIGTTAIDDFAESAHPLLDDARDIGLEPRWVVRGAANLSRGRRVGPRVAAESSTVALRPSLRLDFVDGEVQLTLPAIPDVQQPVPWEVLIGDRQRSIVADLDTSGAFISSEELSLPVTSPIRVVTVSTSGRPVEIPLWESGAPVALFTPSGAHRAVSAGVVTPGTYWALLPAGASMTVEGVSSVVARDDAPLGWAGWDLAQVVLLPGQLVHVEHAAGQFALRVRGGESPQLLAPAPVEGARAFGMAVWAERPRVRIPDSSGTWRISVGRRGSSQHVWAVSVDKPGDYELFEGLFGQAGTFEVSVRGPLGHGMKETFALIDGLAISAAPAHRTLDAQGRLSQASATARADVGITLIPTSWDLASRENTKVVKVSMSTGEHYSFVHRPPATVVGVTDPQGVIRWAPRPAHVDSATLPESPVLLVRTPGRTPPALSAVADGVVVQQISGKPQLTAWRYRLGELAGSFAEHGPLRLFLPDGQPVAWVSPRPTFRGAQLHQTGHAVELMEFSGDATEMEAWVWLEQAVWRAPARLPIQPGGLAPLPESHQGAGPLLVHVRACDPWVPQEDPRLPVPSYRVEAPGEVLLSAAEAAVVRVARGEPGAQLLPESASVLVDVWLGGWHTWRRLGDEAVTRLRAGCAPTVATVVTEAARRGLDRRETARVLVLSGAAAGSVEVDAGSERELWLAAPWLAAAVGMQWLSSADDEAAEKMRRAAVREFGDALLEALETGEDPYATVGRFDQATTVFEAMPSDRASALLAGLGIVPKALLDRDSRADRIRRISQLRGHTDLTWIPYTKHLVAEAEAALQASGLDALAADIAALRPATGDAKHHWLPPFARAAALTARLAARGERRATQVSAAAFAAHEKLAEADPDLVLAELARAEAILVHLGDTVGGQAPTTGGKASTAGPVQEEST